MRRSLAAITCSIAIAIAHALPAQAEAIDPSTATCAEMSKALGGTGADTASKESQERLGVMMIWMAGFLAPESQGTVFDLVKLQADMDVIKGNCDQTPTLGIKTVAAKLWERRQPTTTNSIDISTIKCSALTRKQEDRAAAAVIWLVGNYASDEETPMFDMDAIGKSIEQIAMECAKAPNLSLATAAEKVLEE